MKKRLLAFTLLASLLVLPAVAQTSTNTEPTPTLWDFVTTGSNYWAVPYATYSVGDHSFGGGVAVGYKVSEIVSPMIRLDYFQKQFWMPSLTAQIQPPRSIMGKIPIIPFLIGGVATPIGGAGVDNGTAIGVVGAGAALKLDFVGKGSFWQHADIVCDYENWIGMPTKQQNQVRFGVLFKF